MTGADHEREAEQLLALAREQREDQKSRERARAYYGEGRVPPARFVAPCAELIAEAQVHATLALLAETRATNDAKTLS